jgi:hypothetical protein
LKKWGAADDNSTLTRAKATVKLTAPGERMRADYR